MDIRAFFSPKSGKEVSKGGDTKKQGKSSQDGDRKRKSSSKTSESSDGGNGNFKAKKSGKSSKKKQRIILDSDSDEDPIPSHLRKSKNNGTTKDTPVKKSSYFNDSDEEEVIPSSVKKKSKHKEEKPSKTIDKNEKKRIAPEKPKIKSKVPVNPEDFFGSSPTSRSDRKTFAKRKQSSDPDTSVEDVDFLEDQSYKPPTKKVKESQDLVDEKNKTSTTSQKLSSAMAKSKTESNNNQKEEVKSSHATKSPEKSAFVPDTPESVAKSNNTSSKSPRKLPSFIKGKSMMIVETPTPPKPSSKVSEKTEKIKVSKSPIKSASETQGKAKLKSPHKDADSKAAERMENKTPKKADVSSPSKSSPNKTPETVISPSLEKKRSGYHTFMSRSGPQALGSKEIPQGAENCLEGLTFVITGVLESIDRDMCADLIKRHGGKVTTGVSKKTSYLVMGRDAGQSKADKAKQLGTKVIDEDGLFELISSSPAKKSSYEVAFENQEKSKDIHKTKSSVSKPLKECKSDSQSSAKSSPSLSSSQSSVSSSPSLKGAEPSDSLLWVDKHRPKAAKSIIGQQGDKSNMRKLMRWLQQWHQNRSKGKNKGFFNKDDGSIFKAALLSGPPGVGKTTTAQLVCQELGMTYVELNASDSRSKKTLEEVIATSLGNCVLDRYKPGAVKSNSNHVLIMDEVDGMAGNEDRGGIAELIALIKGTKTPIICICNDRSSPKIRSLVNHCFDLRFFRPRVEQIKGAMMSVAYREGLKIPPQAMEQIIVSANQDIRQVLHNLSMWSTTNKSMSYDQAKTDANKATKDIKLDPFTCIRKVFSMSEGGSLNLFEKSDLFFNDYSLMPLFAQENYLSVIPYAAKGDPKKVMDLISQTADTFCDSDHIEKCIRSQGSWSLLPVQAFFSCVIPGDTMRGSMGQRIEFPTWFGKNSRKGKFDRILQELLLHMRLSTSGNKTDIGLDYLFHLRNNLVKPLIAEGDNGVAGVPRVIELMDSYTLTREDWDSLMEVGLFEGRVDPVTKIPTKVKSAFTRTYNKGSHLAHYTLTTASKKKRGAGTTDASYGAGGEDEAVEEVDDEESEDVALNPMIKAKKPSTSNAKGKKGKSKETKSESKESKSGKGKGKGKGKSSKN